MGFLIFLLLLAGLAVSSYSGLGGKIPQVGRSESQDMKQTEPLSLSENTEELSESDTTEEYTINNNSNKSEEFGDWVYPSSYLDYEGGFWVTEDDVEQVTHWYEEKLRAGGFNIKNIIRTKTNERIENRLSGVSDKQNISVLVKKNPGEGSVAIFLSLD